MQRVASHGENRVFVVFDSILGRGAFGDVYEGSLMSSADGSHRTSVAIKVRRST